MDLQYIFIESTSPSDFWARALSIASGIIALCALGATLYQAHLMRVHNRLSVRPHLALHVEEGPGRYKIELRNDGIGPAIITSALLRHQGVAVEGWGQPLIKNGVALLPLCELVESEFFKPEFVLPPGEKISIATIEHNPIITAFDDYLASHLELTITYNSAYGEEFQLMSERP